MHQQKIKKKIFMSNLLKLIVNIEIIFFLKINNFCLFNSFISKSKIKFIVYFFLNLNFLLRQRFRSLN